MKMKKNRWLIALAGVGLHISIGSVYAWSVFTSPLQDKIGWTLSEVSLIFSIAIFFLGVSAAFMGHFVEKHGPRKSGLISTIFFTVGLALSGFAVSIENLYLLYFGYGVLGGIGLGIGYITPVSTLVKWFPDRRGMATGLAIMGFGFAAMIASPVMSYLIDAVGISNTFYIMASIYFVIMICASLYLEKPAEGYSPVGRNLEEAPPVKEDYTQLMANEAIKTRRFYFLWFMLFINVTCGIAILAVASPMGQEVAGLSPKTAALMVGIMGVFNGAGRLIWATVSDYIGRPNLYTTFFILQIVIFALLPFTSNALIFMLMLFLMVSCYGGGFSAIPAYIADLFGTKQLGAIHGYILTAWAMAGLVGPFIVSKVREATESYNLTLYLFVAFFVIALILSLVIRQDINRIKTEYERAQDARA